MAASTDADTAAVEQFWAEAIAAGSVRPDERYIDADCFGDSAEMADELLELILHGPKRATAASLADHEACSEPIPQVGDLFVATDGAGQPRAVTRTTEVRVGPLSSVDDGFAWDEGEGDRSRTYWLDAHTECFIRVYDRLDLDFHPDIEVVFERFELVHPRHSPSPPPT